MVFLLNFVYGSCCGRNSDVAEVPKKPTTTKLESSPVMPIQKSQEGDLIVTNLDAPSESSYSVQVTLFVSSSLPLAKLGEFDNSFESSHLKPILSSNSGPGSEAISIRNSPPSQERNQGHFEQRKINHPSPTAPWNSVDNKETTDAADLMKKQARTHNMLTEELRIRTATILHKRINRITDLSHKHKEIGNRGCINENCLIIQFA